MGKLLQKLVHGLVPSWLTKVKSANPSPRKALPFFKPGAHHSPSITSPSSSTTPAPSNNTGVFTLAHDEGAQHGESSSTAISPKSSSMLRHESDSEKAESMHQHEESHVMTSMLRHESDSEKADSMHQHEESHVMTMSRHESDSEKADSLHQHEESHPYFLHVKEYKHHKSQPKQGDDMPLKSQSVRRNIADLDAVVLHADACEETLKLQKELWHMQEGIHQHGSDETGSYSSGYFESAYKELLGFKRKSQYLQAEVDEEEGEEEEESGGGGGSGDIIRWAWKRRKGEKGILSCELPESICSIVGNGRAVVKQSLDPQHALWESMVEMIVGNGLHELGNLEFLLYCYLSLNEPHLYPIIQASFLQVLKDLERIA